MTTTTHVSSHLIISGAHTAVSRGSPHAIDHATVCQSLGSAFGSTVPAPHTACHVESSNTTNSFIAVGLSRKELLPGRRCEIEAIVGSIAARQVRHIDE